MSISLIRRWRISVTALTPFRRDQWMGANCLINVPVKVVFNPRSKAALQRNILMVYEYLNTYEAWSNTLFHTKENK